MSYRLDGIETAMEDAIKMPRYRDEPIRMVRCPCGHEETYCRDPALAMTLDLAALRFHYTHCPKAKKGALDFITTGEVVVGGISLVPGTYNIVRLPPKEST